MKIKLLIASFSLAILSSCVNYDKSQLDNLAGNVIVIGHAGSGFSSWLPFNSNPSNSLASIKDALAEGADGIEVDVHMTADKQFILYHDNKLDSKSKGFGCPSDHNLADLEKIDYQLGFPFDLFQTEKLISLETAVLELKKQGSKLDLHLDLRNFSECHDESWNQMWEEILLDHLHRKLKEWAYPVENIYLISYSKKLILKAKEKKLPYHLSFEIVGETESGVEWLLENQISSVTIKPSLLTRAISKELHENGIRVITFGARSKSGNKDLLFLNPDILQTNNVSALKELVND